MRPTRSLWFLIASAVFLCVAVLALIVTAHRPSSSGGTSPASAVVSEQTPASGGTSSGASVAAAQTPAPAGPSSAPAGSSSAPGGTSSAPPASAQTQSPGDAAVPPAVVYGQTPVTSAGVVPPTAVVGVSALPTMRSEGWG